jgi:hypothetical protein
MVFNFGYVMFFLSSPLTLTNEFTVVLIPSPMMKSYVFDEKM